VLGGRCLLVGLVSGEGDLSVPLESIAIRAASVVSTPVGVM